MLMIARDEEANIRSHLALYGQGFFDAYVLGIDSKSRDDTAGAVAEILGDEIPGTVFSFEYSGLGRARTLCLQKAWEVRI